MLGTYIAPDGLRLAVRSSGTGQPLVCLPGGPGRTPDYLGDLGGVGGRELVFPHLRGTGSSAVPDDPGSYRADLMTGDVEALRQHLGLDRIDLLAHSAGADLALLYAARYPDRVSRLVLLTPSLDTVGIAQTAAEFFARLQLRSAEPWYAEALAAVQAVQAGDLSAETRQTFRPFLYGRWDDAARAHDAAAAVPVRAVAAGWLPEGAVDVAHVRDQLGGLAAPVLVYAAELDASPAPADAFAVAKLFPDATVVVQPGSGHFPWVDDPAWCARALEDFLR